MLRLPILTVMLVAVTFLSDTRSAVGQTCQQICADRYDSGTFLRNALVGACLAGCAAALDSVIADAEKIKEKEVDLETSWTDPAENLWVVTGNSGGEVNPCTSAIGENVSDYDTEECADVIARVTQVLGLPDDTNPIRIWDIDPLNPCPDPKRGECPDPIALAPESGLLMYMSPASNNRILENR